MEFKDPGSTPLHADQTTAAMASQAAAEQAREAVEDIVAGSVAGAVSKIIEYPFDTVKVRLQSQPAGQPPQYTGPVDCFRKSIARSGVVDGLFRGVGVPTVGAAIETSALFMGVRPLCLVYVSIAN